MKCDKNFCFCVFRAFRLRVWCFCLSPSLDWKTARKVNKNISMVSVIEKWPDECGERTKSHKRKVFQCRRTQKKFDPLRAYCALSPTSTDTCSFFKYFLFNVNNIFFPFFFIGLEILATATCITGIPFRRRVLVSPKYVKCFKLIKYTIYAAMY